MRPSSSYIPAARVLHENLVSLGQHPTGPGFDEVLSPCDGCVDLSVVVIEMYALAWQGPRANQR